MPRRQRIITGDVVKQSSGLYIRSETTDIYVESQLKQYELLNLKNAVVLDLGGHIGSFALVVMRYGAKCCISVEPYPDNCELFRMNTVHNASIKLIDAAVVSSKVEAKELILYVSQTDTLAHSLTDIRGRVPISVSAIKLEDLLTEYEPHVVKMDIEGSEYDLMHDMRLFLDYGVEYIAAELHLNLRNWRELGKEFITKVEKYYDPLRSAKIGPKNWNTIGVWELK